MAGLADVPTADEYKTRPEYINSRAILDVAFSGNLNAFSQAIKRFPQQVGGMINDHPSRAIGARIASPSILGAEPAANHPC